MKILLAGMNGTDNQFGRSLAKYGCEVIHTSADPGSFPTECDAAVIVKCQISHKKFEDVKNTYKALKKPIFVASIGFTQIKEEFESYVERMKPPPPLPTPVLKVPEVPRRGFSNIPVMLKEEGKKVKRIIRAEDDPDNDRYVPPEDRYVPPEDRSTKVAVVPVRSPAPTSTQVGETTAATQLALIDRVLSSGLPQDQVLRLLTQIRSGEVIKEETITADQVRQDGETVLQVTKSSIFAQTESHVISLKRSQALAIAAVWSQVEDFATGED